MIPKIIHYVWLGGKEIPENLRTYMDSWRQMMPTWEVRGWTEANIPAEVLNVPYVQQALSARKFAFASDYIRLWALEQFGGVYLDTDVEVLRSFDDLPEFTQRCQTPFYTAFIGFEESLAHLPGTCVMGCEPHCQWVRDMLATYNNASFLRMRENLHTGTDPLCKFDLTTNVQRMGKAMVEQYGLIPNGKEQLLCKLVSDTFLHNKEFVHVYDHHYFSPITSTRVMRKNKNTYAIHHFAGSWTGIGHGHWYDHPFYREIINAMIQVKRFIKKQK